MFKSKPQTIRVTLTNDDHSTTTLEFPVYAMPLWQRPGWWLRCRWTDIRNAVYWLRGGRW